MEEAAPTLESLHPLVLRLVQQGVRFATHSYSVGAGGTGGHGGGGVSGGGKRMPALYLPTVSALPSVLC